MFQVQWKMELDNHLLKVLSSSKEVFGKSLIIAAIIYLLHKFVSCPYSQADRVEISPLQLSAATLKAERLSVKVSKPIRVLGWYHSHPHITVQASHVGNI